MKKAEVFSELKKAVKNSNSGSVRELINVGKTYWYRGCPVNAPDKMIALSLETGITIQIKEEDIVEVKKHDNMYMVQVKEGTNILASQQMLTQVGVQSEECDCNTDSENESISTKSSLTNTDFIDIFEPPRLGFYFCYNEPYLTERCFNFRNECGEWERICIPYWSSRRICRWV